MTVPHSVRSLSLTLDSIVQSWSSPLLSVSLEISKAFAAISIAIALNDRETHKIFITSLPNLHLLLTDGMNTIDEHP